MNPGTAAGIMALLAGIIHASAMQATPQGLPFATAASANTWLAAAADHEPGVNDAPLQEIATWREPQLVRVLADVRDLPSSDELNALLERAAMLHADIALLSRDSAKPLAEGWTSEGTAMLVQDGRAIGFQTLDPQIGFARRVLSAMRPPPPPADRRESAAAERQRIEEWHAARAKNPRIRQWYRAIAADFAERHWLADLRPHLRAAREMLPDDPGVLFDSGCLAEVIASPQVQQGLPRPPRASVLNVQPLAAELGPLALSARINIADAEKFYRAALAADPSFDEARVRLSRVLVARDRARDALGVVQVPTQSADPLVRYYAALARGDALERNGRLDDARQAYEVASALFARAQTPLIAIARVARELGDGVAAKAAAGKLAALPPVGRQDPWWIYHDCNGRNAAREIETLRAMFRTSSTR